MAQISLSKLQNQVDKLQKDNTKLRDLLAVQKEKNISLQKQIKYMEKHIEEKIKKSVEEFASELIKENEKLRDENEKLKHILNQDSNNSGIPTSKTPIGKEKRIPNSREQSDKSKGGQKGHPKYKLERFKDDEITETREYTTDSNCSCGGKLIDTGYRSKDEYEISIRLDKIRHNFHTYKCSCCGKEIKIPIPDNLKEENQYGSTVQAMAISLVNEGCVSFHRTKELIRGFSGLEINMSESYIVKLQKRCYNLLEEFDRELHKIILRLKVLHWDDTVITIDGKQACLRYYGTEKIAYYKAHKQKNKEGLDEDGILEFLRKEAVVMHDHNIVNYNKDYNFTNAECCVHLIRDLIDLNNDLSREWIDKLIKLLVDTNNKRKEYIEQSIMYFDQEVTDKVIVEYDKIIEEGKEINKKDFNKYHGNDEKTLLNRLIEYKENYLLWVLRFDVPFSNNLSERSLRSSKTKMKVSGQFANVQNAEYYARIKTYIETCKRSGYNSHESIRKLIEGTPYTVKDLDISVDDLIRIETSDLNKNH